jgi:LysR family transcriptional regulator, low CO2-responsive transcriptional regulator
MINLNSHQLNVFLIAAETLNFTQAAQRLKMTQPSVSQHVMALEEHFGLPLFVRAGRSLELTEAGLALIPLARQMVYLANHTEETMASLVGGVQGHLIVGCSTASGRYILPKLLADFHQAYPQVRATCLVTSQVEALDMLLQGKAHLALAANPEQYSDIEFKKFTSEPVTLITPLDHPWGKRGSVRIADLGQGDFILPTEGSEIFEAIREAFAHAGRSIYELSTLMTLGSLEAIALSVQEGLGVGFVPDMIINRLVHNTVRRVQLEDVCIIRDIFMGRSMRRPPTGALEAFWDFANQSRFSFGSPDQLSFAPSGRGMNSETLER